MTRFAWLQSRTQTLATLAALAALAIVAAITGVRLSHQYNSLAAACSAGNCGVAPVRVLAQYSWLQDGFELLLRLAPAIIGIFWGAPLVARELESGTYRLAWTQGVTRSRWLTTKLLLVGASAIAAAGVLTLTITWWFRVLDKVGSNRYDLFDRRDLAPVAYTAFAFTLGAFLGTVIRRTLPAMAATLGIFAFTRVAVTAWVRPHLLAPLQQSMPLLPADVGFTPFTPVRNGTPDLVAGSPTIHNAWVQSSQLVTSSGQAASAAQRSAFISQYCPTIAHPSPPGPSGTFPGDQSAFDNCRQQAASVFHLAVRYQPAGRYWTFQWLEAGTYTVLALGTAFGCYWWTTRRAT